MNRTLKRVLGLAGSVALGVTGALTFASAAQAHHVEVEWSTECADDGGWVVTWEVTDWNSHRTDPGVIKKVKSTGGTLTGDIVKDAELPHPNSGDKLVGVQTLSNDETTATLSIDAKWGKHKKNSGFWKVSQPDGGCEIPVDPEPVVGVSVLNDCFGIEIVSFNENPEKLSEITYVPSAGEAISHTPEVGEEFAKYFLASDPEAGLSVQVLVDGEEYGLYEWDLADTNCEWGYIYDTCEGLEFELAIPEDGVETTYTFTPSEGDVVVVTVTPGGTETVSFPASGDELTVAYAIEDGSKFPYEGEVPWEKPEDCDDVPPSEEPTTPAAQLPVTGSSMSIMISAAAALVVAAAVLFFVARRRRAAADW